MTMKEHFQFKRDIAKLLVEQNSQKPVQKIIKKRIIPKLSRLNDDVPYLTEEKIEDAFYSEAPNKKTIKLLRWLSIQENLNEAFEFFKSHPDRFEDCNDILSSQKTNFDNFIKSLIVKHEQAISQGE